jgi:glycosyltransferase involved in cell wall biosynthesis
LSTEKGHADLVEAMALLRARRQTAIRLVIVGDGPEREALQRQAMQRGVADCILFTGHQESVGPYYGMADVFVLPSHSEGSPNALLEAMAAGLPIVSTAAGGAAEMVADERSALVVERGNPGAISCAVDRLLGDKELAGRLAAAAQVAARAYTAEAYTVSLLKIYAAVAADNAARRWR